MQTELLKHVFKLFSKQVPACKDNFVANAGIIWHRRLCHSLVLCNYTEQEIQHPAPV